MKFKNGQQGVKKGSGGGGRGRSGQSVAKMNTARLQKLSVAGGALPVNQMNAQLELLYRRSR